MGKFKEFVPVVGALVVVALCALIPLGVGLGDDGLADVRSSTAALATTNLEGQGLQAAAQQVAADLGAQTEEALTDGSPIESAAVTVQPDVDVVLVLGG